MKDRNHSGSLVILLFLLLTGLPVLAQEPDWSLPPDQATALVVPAGRVDAAIGQIDSLVTEVMEATGIPGVAVAVVHQGEPVFVQGYGVTRSAGGGPVDADTVFQLASLSKSVAATVVASQVGAGLVDWDTPVASLLPWFALGDPWVS